MPEKKRIPLYDLAVWKNGLAFRDVQFSSKGKPVIKIAELKNGITDQTKFTKDEFDDSVALCKGDMLFSWSGNPSTSIDVFYYDLPSGWLNQHIFKVTPIGIDKRFLYYLLKSHKPIFTAIASNKQTTGLGHVTIKDLKELIVDVPTLEFQIKIAETLGALDDKIENNTKINHHLPPSRSATDNSPDIKRGKRVSRKSIKTLRSAWLTAICFRIPIKRFTTFVCTSIGGKTNFSFLKSLRTILGSADPDTKLSLMVC